MMASVDHAPTLLTAAREVVDGAVFRLADDVRGANARVDLARLDREQGAQVFCRSGLNPELRTPQ